MSKVLESLSKKRGDAEGFNPIPEGYKIGKTKYIVVVGSVISGLGKGIVSASIGRLLKECGKKVSPIKFDGYLNVDAGTLNPFRHGEVFVLDDGTECDMDLGTYERFLDADLSKINYLTSGKLFKMIIDKERRGGFLGRDVQFIPHVTGEIKRFIRELGLKTDADVVMVEIGGTIGDIENSYFIEAMREFSNEEGKDNVLFVNVTYILDPKAIGEQKSKAAQLGLRALMGQGIQPDLIVCRSEHKLNDKIKDKLSVFSNVPVSHVLSSPDVSTVYEVPLVLYEQGVLDLINEQFDWGCPQITLDSWAEYVKKIKSPSGEVNVAIAGKYTALADSYASIIESLKFAGAENDVKVNIEWIETTGLEEKQIKEKLDDVDGLIVPGGFGTRGVEGKINAIKVARESDIPFLGICYGFQLAVIEFARNVCGLEAHTTEVKKDAKDPVVFLLPQQLQMEYVGATMRLGGRDVEVVPGTLAHKYYGKDSARERFRHRYEINPEYIEQFEKKGLVFSGKAPEAPIMQIGELKDKIFFVGAQFHPELTSRPLRANPLFRELVRASKTRRGSA